MNNVEGLEKNNIYGGLKSMTNKRAFLNGRRDKQSSSRVKREKRNGVTKLVRPACNCFVCLKCSGNPEASGTFGWLVQAKAGLAGPIQGRNRENQRGWPQLMQDCTGLARACAGCLSSSGGVVMQ